MLTSLLKADEHQYMKEMIEEAEYQNFCREHPHLKKFTETFRRMKYLSRTQINRKVICPILGHDIQRCTFFEESRGVEAFWCNRCDHSGHNRLY
jgi:hypothetical protein